MPGEPLHVVTDSDSAHVGLMGKCAKWELHGWVGSSGPPVHRDLWERLWCSWQLLGDSVSVQWVPSHMGVQGNEQADRCAQQGVTAALPSVTQARCVQEAWQDLGREEMSECDESGMSAWDVDSGGSDSRSSSDGTNETIISGDSESDSDCEVLESPMNRHCANRDPGEGGRADPNQME